MSKEKKDIFDDDNFGAETEVSAATVDWGMNA